MGRFATTVAFYRRYREPYPPEFFRAVAGRLALSGKQALLDVGCGPGPLAIGFAPFVSSAVGLDPEPAMVEAASAAAGEAGAEVTFRLGRLEDFQPEQAFDLVTIGRAMHWLDRGPALQVLERILAGNGRVLICGAGTVETSSAPWVKPYEDLRRSWADGAELKIYRVKPLEWFAGSPFHQLDLVSATHLQQVSIENLIGRALSKSNTSPAVLGERQPEFERQIRAVLEPYARDGFLEEEIVARAVIFGC